MSTSVDSIPAESTPESAVKPLIEVENLTLAYGNVTALRSVSLSIVPSEVTAFIGPSGCGKSSLLRCLNRMNDFNEDARIVEGRVCIHGIDINSPQMDVIALRKRIGMVFQSSNPFPKSIYDNITFGLKLAGMKRKVELDEIVEKSLRRAALWDEVKDALHRNALTLSGGQQQRLCIARAIAVEPDILLMDEPCSALDPIATARIEELIHQLRDEFTIVIVTHNLSLIHI